MIKRNEYQMISLGKLSKVEDLGEHSRGVEIILKVISVSEKATIMLESDQKDHEVAYALVGDETGAILLTVWDEAIERIEEDQVIELDKAYVSEYEGKIRLNIGRYGSFKILESASFDDVNLENNLSEK